MKYIIYKTINTVNDKFYVGQTTESAFNNGYSGSGTYIKAAINRYGKENFKTECLEVIDDKDKVKEREEYWINELNSCDPSIGYNAIDKSAGNSSESLTERIQVLITKTEYRLLNEFIIKDAMDNSTKPLGLSPFVREIIKQYLNTGKVEQRSFAAEEVQKYIDAIEKEKSNK